MTTMIPPSSLPSMPSVVKAHEWKSRHWTLAVLLPATGLMVTSVIGLGYVPVEGTSLAIIFAILAILSLLVPCGFWARIDRLAGEWKDEQQRRKEQENQTQEKKERNRQQAIIEHFSGLGLTKFALDTLPLPHGHDTCDEAAIARSLLDHGLRQRVEKLLVEAREARPTEGSGQPGPTLLALALPQPLLLKLSVDEIKFFSRLRYYLREQLVSSLTSQENTSVDPTLAANVPQIVRLDVWRLAHSDFEPQDWTLGFLLEKPLMGPDELIHYTVRSLPGSGSSLQAAQFFAEPRDPTVEARNLLLMPQGATLTAFTEDCATAARDVILPAGARQMQKRVSELHGNRTLQRELGIHIVRQESAFPLLDTYTSRFKGSITCVGWWDDEGWHPLPQPVRSRLSASAPNFLLKGFSEASGAAANLAYDHENLLLRNLLALQEKDFSRAIGHHGNFVIQRGPKQDGSSVYKYFIKATENSETVTRILRTSGQHSREAYQHRESYEDLDSRLQTLQPAPLEREGYLRLPFSEGYLLTGGSSLQLCLYLDLGSPSLGEDVNAPFIQDEVTLPTSLKAYAMQSGATEASYELLGHAAQGLTARVEIPGQGECYLKLLEASHTRSYGTLSILQRLIDARILPAGIRHRRINSLGLPSQHGQLFVFTTAACRSVADGLVTETLDIRERLLVWMELNRFLLRLHEKGLSCTDITLRDLMHEAATLAEATTPPATPNQPGLFVVDYASYIRHSDFRREVCIVKEEMSAPEDWDHRLPYEPEAYQVFLQGLLAVQILLADPGYIPAAVLRQSAHLALAEMQEELWAELESRLSPLLADLPEQETILATLHAMLHPDPTRRLRLSEIAE